MLLTELAAVLLGLGQLQQQQAPQLGVPPDLLAKLAAALLGLGQLQQEAPQLVVPPDLLAKLAAALLDLGQQLGVPSNLELQVRSDGVCCCCLFAITCQRASLQPLLRGCCVRESACPLLPHDAVLTLLTPACLVRALCLRCRAQVQLSAAAAPRSRHTQPQPAVQQPRWVPAVCRQTG